MNKNKRNKQKRKMLLGAIAGLTIIGTVGTVISCGSFTLENAGTSYRGPRTTLRFYLDGSANNGNPYAGQTWWATNPDNVWALTSNVMGAEMNSSTRPALVRPINVGIPNYVRHQDKSKPITDPGYQTYTNEGQVTDTYFAFDGAGSIILTLSTGETLTYNSDQHPDARKDTITPIPKTIPWNSINSNAANVQPGQDADKNFANVMSGNFVPQGGTAKAIVTKIAFTMRPGHNWGDNMGEDTKVPVTAMDYWYGLNTSHLNTDDWRAKNGGDQTKDAQMNTNYGAQLGQGSSGWESSYNQFHIDTTFLEDSMDSSTDHGKAFMADGNVNFYFNKQMSNDDPWNAFNALFINQNIVNARPSQLIDKLVQKQFSTPASLCEKYGYYIYPTVGFQNILYASEYTIEIYEASTAIYHLNKAYAVDPADSEHYTSLHSKQRVQNIVYNYTKEASTFPSTQFQKYIQGSSVEAQFSILTDHDKALVNDKPDNFGVRFKKAQQAAIATTDTTWSALMPTGTDDPTKDIKNGNQAYFNDNYAKTLFGYSLNDLMTKKSFPNLFDHYFSIGTAFRSTISSAINWYTAMLTINKGSSSNWGGNLPPNLQFKGTDSSSDPYNEPVNSYDKGDSTKTPPMTSEYSVSYDPNTKTFGNQISISTKDQEEQYIKNFANQQASFKSDDAKFKLLQSTMKQILDSTVGDLGNKPDPNSSAYKNWGVIFELPIRSWHSTPQEVLGLENMRQVINSLDPRLHAVGTAIQSTTPPYDVTVGHEAFDSGYVNDWVNDTLPRLSSWRYVSRSNNTLTTPAIKPGIWGFLDADMKYLHYGALQGFSRIANQPASAFSNSAQMSLLKDFVDTIVVPAFEKAQKDLDSSKLPAGTGLFAPSSIAAIIKNQKFEELFQSDSAHLFQGTGGNYIGLKGFENLYGNTFDSSNNPLSNPGVSDNISNFNTAYQTYIIDQTATNIVATLNSTKTDVEQARIFAAMDTYFGRSIEFLQRKIPNVESLPAILDKTWWKKPVPASGIEFYQDMYIEGA